MIAANGIIFQASWVQTAGQIERIKKATQKQQYLNRQQTKKQHKEAVN